MRRCTRSAAALLLAASLAACSSPAPVGTERIAGLYGPLDPIVLVNLTLPDGRYLVSADFALYILTRGRPVDFTCAIVDTTGQFGIIAGSAVAVRSGRWFELTLGTEVELPDTTLGLRCFPQRTAYVDVLVENAQLGAEQIP